MTRNELLDRAGLVYKAFNGGLHLRVEGRDEYIDYWPTTGKWKAGSGVIGFGVTTLIERVKGKPEKKVEEADLSEYVKWKDLGQLSLDEIVAEIHRRKS